MSIPDLGPLEGSSNLVSRKGGYGTDNVHALIGDRGNALLKAEGRIEYVMRGTDVAFEGINLAVEMTNLDTRIIADHVGNQKIDVGKIGGRMSMSGDLEDLSIADAKLSSVSHDGLEMSAQLNVRHMRLKEDIPLKGIEVELSASAQDMTAIRRITGLGFPDLGPLSMKASVNDRDGRLDVEKFHVQTGSKEESTLSIDGSMRDILSREQMDFSITFEAATRPWLEEFYGHLVSEDHRLQGEAKLLGTSDNFRVNGSASSGKTHITTTIEKSPVNERPRLVAKISAPTIYLDDLGIYPEYRERKDSAKKERAAPQRKIFSDKPYDSAGLKEMDLLLSIDSEEVKGRDFTLKDLDVDISLDDGLLHINPARLTYADGFVSIEYTLDTRGPEPEMTLNMTAEDIDVADLLSHIHAPMFLGGHLNLAVDLRGAGSSPGAIASSLNGDIGMTIEHGQIKQIADLMGADAIDFVSSVRQVGKYQKINCMALAFSFKDGIGSSTVIYLDSPSVRSTGKGTVNLSEENVDIVIQPKPKKGQLGGSSPVTIRGSLANPLAQKLPYIEAARLSGEILIPYVFLPARALGYTWYLMKDDKDEKSPCFAQSKEN
jgi:hypothetical protein